MIFAVRSIPALGFSTVFVTVSSEAGQVNKVRQVLTEPGQSRGLEISPTISANMLYYVGSKYAGQPSGAYVFRPDGGKEVLTDSPLYSQTTGPLVNESIVELSDWGVLTARTYPETDQAELTWQVGPISGGREVVVVLTTDINNTGGQFYTDANGRQMMRRVLRRDTAEPIAANYYPVTSRLEIRGEEEDSLVSLLTDRSQGGSSLQTGELEVMVHRRCQLDDWFGVGEALEEEAFGAGLVARGQHSVLAGTSLAAARLRQQELVLPPRLSLLGAALSLEDWLSAGAEPYSALSGELEESLQVSIRAVLSLITTELIRFSLSPNGKKRIKSFSDSSIYFLR